MKGRGAVAAGDRHTAEAAATMLRAGGNAVDAAVAGACASFIAEPPLSGPAGGGVAISGARGGDLEVLDFFATMPSTPVRRDKLDFSAITIDFGTTTQSFHVGRGAVAVPTVLPGLLELLARHGTMPLTDVLAPAIALARGGCELSDSIRWVVALLEPIVSFTPGLQELYTANGEVAPADAPVANARLADTLERVAAEGLDFVRGEFAADFAAAFGPGNGGLVTAADIRGYRPVVRKPLSARFGDHTVLTNPPPSSGGVLIAAGLRLAEQVGIGRHPFLSPAHATRVGTVLAAMSRAHRAQVDAATGPEALSAAVVDEAALAGWLVQAEERHLGGTTHISALDKQGGIASVTLTNGEGCGHVLPGYGIHANNLLGEEDINPRGFHALAPGARMTTMMAPTVVLRGGVPTLVLGSGGSNRIRSAILQVLLHVLCHRLPLHDAVRAPRLHVESDHLWFERQGLGDGADAALRVAFPSHTSFDEHSMFFGGVHAVGRDGEAGDLRRGGSIVVVP